MSSPDDVAMEGARAEIARAAELLARARGELVRGSAPTIGPLAALIDPLEHRLGAVPRVPPDFRPALLALLDEAARLAAELDVEMRDLAERLRAAGVRRRADVAYRRPPGAAG